MVLESSVCIDNPVFQFLEEDAPQISRYFGGKRVDFYHNPTAMAHEDDMAGYYKDLTQAGTQKLGNVLQKCFDCSQLESSFVWLEDFLFEP